MGSKYAKDDIAYLIESNRFVREVKVIKFSGGLYTIQFRKGGGGIKVRESRLFPTREEAEAAISTPKAKPAQHHPTPWD